MASMTCSFLSSSRLNCSDRSDRSRAPSSSVVTRRRQSPVRRMPEMVEFRRRTGSMARNATRVPPTRPTRMTGATEMMNTRRKRASTTSPSRELLPSLNRETIGQWSRGNRPAVFNVFGVRCQRQARAGGKWIKVRQVFCLQHRLAAWITEKHHLTVGTDDTQKTARPGC